jgi:hypothetical protein
METYFEISESGDSVRVEVLKYAHYGAESDWDKNWVKSKVAVKAGSFSGEYNAEFRTTDFDRFKKDFSALYDNLSGGALFSDLEGYLELRIVGDGNGHFEMKATANDKPGIYGSQLTFEMNFDQTYIKDIVRQLDRITEAFPVVGNLNKA